MSLVNGIHHIEVHTVNLTAFLAFYRETLQAEAIGEGVPGSGRREAIVDVGGGGLLHVLEVDGSAEPVGREHLALKVASREALVEARQRLMARGCCDGRVKDFGSGRALPFHDEEGRRCELMWEFQPEAPIHAPRWLSGDDLEPRRQAQSRRAHLLRLLRDGLRPRRQNSLQPGRRGRAMNFAGAMITATVALGLAAPAASVDTGAHPALPLASIGSGNAAACPMTRTGEYPQSSPSAVGLDPTKLKGAIDYWTSEASETVKVFRHGCLVGQSGLDPITERAPRENWSHTKTVNSLIAGVAARQGLIKIDDPIGNYLPEGLGDAAHRAITIRQVLTMTTGLQMNWIRGLNLYTDISRAREALAMPFAHKPGEYFEYDQLTPSLVTYVVQQSLNRHRDGQDYQDFAQEELFNKLGIPRSAYWWQRDRSGNTLAYLHLFMRPLEFGRLGELMRRNGVYDGVRIIDQAYLQQLRTGTNANCSYGFMVWLNSCAAGQTQVSASVWKRRVIEPAGPIIASAPSDMYFSWGYHGQHTFVIPSLDMVITRTGDIEPDVVQNVPNDGGTGAAIGDFAAQGYFTFFHKLMASINDLTSIKAASIRNTSGVFDGAAPTVQIDLATFDPTEAVPASYLAVGPHSPQDCTVAGCVGDPNQGDVRWLSDVPRTAPGVLGRDRRPNG